MQKKRAHFLPCTHSQPYHRHTRIHEEKMRPTGRISAYTSFGFEIVVVLRVNDT
jgi:hypothetical protein